MTNLTCSVKNCLKFTIFNFNYTAISRKIYQEIEEQFSSAIQVDNRKIDFSVFMKIFTNNEKSLKEYEKSIKQGIRSSRIFRNFDKLRFSTFQQKIRDIERAEIAISYGKN